EAANDGDVASGSSTIYTAPVLATTAPTLLPYTTLFRSYSGTTAVTLNLTASDAVGVTGYYLSGSATAPLATASGWTAVTATTSYTGTHTYTLPTPNHSKSVHGRYKDAAGNVSTTASASI